MHPTLKIFLGIAMICASTMQAVVCKLAGYSLGPYPYFMLLVISFAFVPIFWIMLGFIYLKTGGFPEKVSKWKFRGHFAVIGLFNALNGVFIIFSNPHTPGNLQAVLARAIVPLTIIFSIVLLKASYSSYEYIGAVIILCGLLIDTVPSFFDTKNDAPINLFWSAMFLLGQVPMALQSVYQEYAFSQKKVNVIYMMAWSSLSQFIVLLVLVPLNFIPKFGTSTPTTFLDHMNDAAMCTLDRLPGHPECSSAALLLGLCILAMFSSNMLQAIMVKYAGAAVVVVVLTVVTPVSALAFTIGFIMKDHVEKFHTRIIVALVVLTFGIILFRYNSIKAVFMRQEPDIVEEEQEPLLVSVPPPRMLSTRCGIIELEYTSNNDEVGSKGILFEHTLLDYVDSDKSLDNNDYNDKIRDEHTPLLPKKEGDEEDGSWSEEDSYYISKSHIS